MASTSIARSRSPTISGKPGSSARPPRSIRSCPRRWATRATPRRRGASIKEILDTGVIGPVRRSPRLGRPRLGPAGRGVRREIRQAARVLQRHPDRRPVQGGDAGPVEHELGSVARPRAGAAVSCDLFPRAAVVSLVGFRQRHDERSRQPRQRRALHGAGSLAAGRQRRSVPGAADGRSHFAQRARRRTRNSRPRR